MTDRWETMLQSWRDHAAKPFLDANAAVGDAVFMAWLYWDAKHPDMKPTPADLLEMARMILEHERWLTEREASRERK
jgi:hypothetical protein